MATSGAARRRSSHAPMPIAAASKTRWRSGIDELCRCRSRGREVREASSIVCCARAPGRRGRSNFNFYGVVMITSEYSVHVLTRPGAWTRQPRCENNKLWIGKPNKYGA